MTDKIYLGFTSSSLVPTAMTVDINEQGTKVYHTVDLLTGDKRLVLDTDVHTVTAVEIVDFDTNEQLIKMASVVRDNVEMLRWFQHRGYLYNHKLLTTHAPYPEWTSEPQTLTPEGLTVKVYGFFGSHYEFEWDLDICYHAFDQQEYVLRDQWAGVGFRVIELPSGGYQYSPYDQHIIRPPRGN
ncbi:hypothetical protein GR11A_00188 [Vibrio phage vB_VcorM_GR11A]|nr:hypothetical protein GR11A_00188 [Vibrio phage vB_VcorM_GR11A]